MNFSDSELMLGLLAREGFVPVADRDSADLLILNTCQIRQNAEDKAFSYLGAWAKLKRRRPEVKIAMAGCVSQQVKEAVFQRAPYVDIVLGTQNLQDLPRLVRRAFAGERHVLAVDRQRPRSTYDYFTDVAAVRASDISAWVTIIEGCDYFCTYCVVPYTRGRQISRPAASVLDEVQQLAARGFKEITLLGQTVDAYGKDFNQRQLYRLSHLLQDISQTPGIERIRFMTSHPLDLTDDLIAVVADLPNVMEYIHIPMQSGDDGVLARMRRGYTASQYYALVEKLYHKIPGVAVSGDYIVGFPGETEAAFAQTLASVAISNICRANTAAYSARKQTPAAVWERRDEGQEVPADIKKERLARLNQAIEAQARDFNQAYLHQRVEVLVEGLSERNRQRFTGRTRSNLVVNFDSPHATAWEEADWVGRVVTVEITETSAWSLLGQAAGP
jgi:tRNA-2-methylthio-N6-dimethylallyladenosine synthase